MLYTVEERRACGGKLFKVCRSRGGECQETFPSEVVFKHNASAGYLGQHEGKNRFVRSRVRTCGKKELALKRSRRVLERIALESCRGGDAADRNPLLGGGPHSVGKNSGLPKTL